MPATSRLQPRPPRRYHRHPPSAFPLHARHGSRRRPVRRHDRLVPEPRRLPGQPGRPPARRRTRDQLRQRRTDLDQPSRALGQPRRACAGAALARARRRAAEVPPAPRPRAVDLGPALPARVPARARAPQHRGDRRARARQRAAPARTAHRARARVRPARARHPAPVLQPRGVRQGARARRTAARLRHRRRGARPRGLHRARAGAGGLRRQPVGRDLRAGGRIGRRAQIHPRARPQAAGGGCGAALGDRGERARD